MNVRVGEIDFLFGVAVVSPMSGYVILKKEIRIVRDGVARSNGQRRWRKTVSARRFSQSLESELTTLWGQAWFLLL